MKKIVIRLLLAAMATTALTGCNVFGLANGVILYGEETEIMAAIEQEKQTDKDQILEEMFYDIQLMEQGAVRTMVLSHTTAQALVKKKLIREITDQEKGKTKVVPSLAEGKKGEAMLFAKESTPDETVANGVTAVYAGNLIIGEGRVYADRFLIVHDADWALMGGADKKLVILRYDKDPSADGLTYDVEDRQLIKLPK